MSYQCGEIHADIIQGSSEWFDIKRAKVGASKIADMMAKGRGNAESAGRRNLKAKLICERLTGVTEETYTNAAMQWGIDNEVSAREVYEYKCDAEVDQVGFVDHPTLEYAGMSPDGLVGKEGMLEIKCPNTATHIDYLLSKKMPSEYVKQVQFQMACSGRIWCDFMSYDPRLGPDLQTFIIRVERDDELIKEIEADIEKMNGEIETTITALMGQGEG
jgi:putative phage-type endonuclease